MAKTSSKVEIQYPCRCGPLSIVTLIVAIMVGPFFLIWAINTLFGIGIAYSVYTWFAALILLFLFARKSMKRRCLMGCNCYDCNMYMQKK